MIYQHHLTSASDLVTPYEKIRAGFVALAIERNRRATPFIDQARVLKTIASQALTPSDLINIAEIQPALLAAAGISDKAANHLQIQDKIDAIQGLIKEFIEPAGSDFVEELVYRFLLTRGDTLGGSMRNVGGVLAQRKLTRAIIATLSLANIPYYWLHSTAKIWIPMTAEDAGIELNLRGLSWGIGGKNRTIIYNLNVPIVKSNIDVCLLDCNYQQISANTYKTPELYIALGELKGGIDPAGADEHWKTAKTALSRIRTAFSKANLSPLTFFIGAAIETRMAGEIWGYLEEGRLSNAANLNNDIHVDSLCHWLISL
ncbi:MAG TPA: AvaI/BsoBI family type II restriction endonuclease [Nostocaceae cyanobacterium]|nr:AvaI/BsoBI family type II restriction endonuclease [Nostocaceae cyanobacterium]